MLYRIFNLDSTSRRKSSPEFYDICNNDITYFVIFFDNDKNEAEIIFATDDLMNQSIVKIPLNIAQQIKSCLSQPDISEHLDKFELI